MKKNLYSLSVVAVTMLALSGSALAEGTNLDVNFTANIRETTCDMKLMVVRVPIRIKHCSLVTAARCVSTMSKLAPQMPISKL